MISSSLIGRFEAGNPNLGHRQNPPPPVPVTNSDEPVVGDDVIPSPIYFV